MPNHLKIIPSWTESVWRGHVEVQTSAHLPCGRETVSVTMRVVSVFEDTRPQGRVGIH